MVRIRQADGSIALSKPFNIARGVLQGHIFSPIAFIAGLDRIFSRHDVHTASVTVGSGDNSMSMPKFEYADDAALVDDDAATATTRVTTIAAGSLNDAAMVISEKKDKFMQGLTLKHVCDSCSRTFPTLRGLRLHVSRWCDGGLTQRSHRGSKADRAVKVVTKHSAEALLDQVHVGNIALENVHSFEYLGAKLQCDGSDEADVLHRMAIAQTTFVSLSNIWIDHRLSRALKLRSYQLAVCSTLTHTSEAWTSTAAVMRSINGFNSRCLHVITGQDYRPTATAPVFDLLRATRQRRLRYLEHILRMPESRVVRRALIALTGSGTHPKGSLLMDCQTIPFENIEALAQRRAA